MEEREKGIPTGKVQRATRFVRTGLKVGGNYINHYSKKWRGEENTQTLHEKNAGEIYQMLSELKGSALKVAQMLSMDKALLPTEYLQKFTEAQYQVPALSAPLVQKTFRQYLGKSPSELFDDFSPNAVHAASMGQVHLARKNETRLAVKVQYPGVAESVASDLAMLRPFAKLLFGWKEADMAMYFEEVQAKLLEETDYGLELRRGQYIANQCQQSPLEGLRFPRYFPEYSHQKILTMEWMDGLHLDAFLMTSPSQMVRNKVGQALWDFFNFQIHHLRMLHADAHPGNYLFTPEGEVIVLDFGCVKELPDTFYHSYYALIQPDVMENTERFEQVCLEGEVIYQEDTEEEKAFLLETMRGTLSLLCKPFRQGHFDFGQADYFDEMYAYGEKTTREMHKRKTSPRGSRHGIYLNRAYFGLFLILHKLEAEVTTTRYVPGW